MALSGRRRARILAYQILYSRSKIGVHPRGEERHIASGEMEEKYIQFGLELAETAWTNIKPIDEAIAKRLINWRQSRLSDSLNAVLRLGVSELMFFPKTDGKVILNEIIEICKMFSGGDASSMCNGVLHAVWQEQVQARKTDKQTPAQEEGSE